MRTYLQHTFAVVVIAVAITGGAAILSVPRAVERGDFGPTLILSVVFVAGAGVAWVCKRRVTTR